MQQTHKTKIVGMGSAGVDYLAQVAAYPQPDEKLRTERLEVQGGGNCGNALTAAARLGLSPCIVTKIGGDAVGDGIIDEFQKEGISTDCILRAPDAPSPFTYIIVDRAGGTRTCIHTPGEPFIPSEMTQELIDRALDNAALVYFDGRLAESAVLLARAARSRGVPVLVEGERLRDGLDDLLLEADYVITSEGFPKAWTGETDHGEAVAKTFTKLPNVKWLVTTMGKRGSVLLERYNTTNSSEVESAALSALIDQGIQQLSQSSGKSGGSGGAGEVACVTGTGVEVRAGGTWTTPKPVNLILSGSNSSNQSKEDNACTAIVTVAQAASLPSEAVLDTTGAGDAFIGSMLYCIVSGIPPKTALKFCAVVAAVKCTALGARPGLPKIEDLANELLL